MFCTGLLITYSVYSSNSVFKIDTKDCITVESITFFQAYFLRAHINLRPRHFAWKLIRYEWGNVRRLHGRTDLVLAESPRLIFRRGSYFPLRLVRQIEVRPVSARTREVSSITGTVGRRVSTMWEASRLPDVDQSMISRESLTHITNDAEKERVDTAITAAHGVRILHLYRLKFMRDY